MKKCPKCHKNIPSNAKVCPYCGSSKVTFGVFDRNETYP